MLSNDNNKFIDAQVPLVQQSEHFQAALFSLSDSGKENVELDQLTLPTFAGDYPQKSQQYESLKGVASPANEISQERDEAQRKTSFRISSSKSKRQGDSSKRQTSCQVRRQDSQKFQVTVPLKEQQTKNGSPRCDNLKEECCSDNEEKFENKDTINKDFLNLTLKKQSVSSNPINYQTASFGGLKASDQQSKGSTAKKVIPNQMFTSMTDIGFSAIIQIIPEGLQEKMTDNSSNWKVRTHTIDEILLAITWKVSEDPFLVCEQTECLMEFFVSLLNDQNFKIVLTTLAIINKLLSLPLQIGGLNGNFPSQSLGRYVPQLVKKLGDSKNIIRQEAIRALINIYEIMKTGDKNQNNFTGLVLPYLNNSTNWHIREELLNVLMICFLKSRNFYDFDAFLLIEAILKLLRDTKERIKLLAVETLVAYASIGNKFSIKEVVYQVVDKATYDIITERLEEELVPFINDDGALEVPYLEQLEMAGNISNASALLQPSNASRKDLMSSSHISKMNGSNMAVNLQHRGIQSSGRKVVPSSAGSIAQQAMGVKRTVSANNQANYENFYHNQLPGQKLLSSIDRKDAGTPSNESPFCFLPQLTSHHSQQYPSYNYDSNKQMQQTVIGSSKNSGNINPVIGQQAITRKPNSDTSFTHLSRQRSGQRAEPSPQTRQHQHRQQQVVGSEITFGGNQNPGVAQNFSNAFNANYHIGSRDFVAHYVLPESQSSKIQEPVNSRSKNNRNTFYSDGSFTTTSTSHAEKMKSRGQNSRLSRLEVSQSANPNQNGAFLGSNVEISDVQNFNQGARNQQQVFVNNSKGPIKATRAAIKKEEAPELDETDQQQDFSKQLCIDNRKLKKPKGKINEIVSASKTDNGQEFANSPSKTCYVDKQPASYSPINSITRNAAMNKTNFNSEYEESAQKHLSAEELEPLVNPEKEFKKCINVMIKSPEWSVQFEACNILRRIAKHNSNVILQQGTQLHSLVSAVLKIADSLRSSLSKIALMTINDMFVHLKRCMESDLDRIVKVLLKKGSDTNAFISDEAEKALISMCSNCQDSKVLQAILVTNVNSKSNILRQRICKCLETLAQNLGNNILFFKDSDKLLNQLSNYLSDACQEVRNIAKGGFLFLSKAIMGKNDLERLLQRVLNETQYKKVKDFLEKGPQHLVSHQQQQLELLITNSNSHFTTNKKQSQKLGKQLSIRQGSLNRSNVSAPQGDQSLNIKATKIIKPSQIVKRKSQTNVLKAGEMAVDQLLIDTMKELILLTQTTDWKVRQEQASALFDFIEQYAVVFCGKSSSRLVEMVDAVCHLINDQNAKIQQLSLERFSLVLPSILPFVELYIQTFLQALASNLASSNIAVRHQTESIMQKINQSVEKTVLVQPLVSLIQFSSNSRLKPLLIEQLAELVVSLPDSKSNLLNKTILPLGYKLLDDKRNDVKIKTENLLRNLFSVMGQRLLDQCPQPKQQKLCDIVMTGSGTGGGTFGANIVASMLNIKSQ